MYILLLILLLIALVAGPGLWVKHVIRRYSEPADRYSRTGGEVARELLDALGLEHVKAETTDQGDHYDPRTRAVRLADAHFNGRSLTAVTIAAHEVGHALQDAVRYPPLTWRTRLVTWVRPLERVGAGLLMVSPLVVAAFRVPAAGLVTFAGGLLALGTGVLVHFVTLPTELDASFNRALPLLEQRQMLHPGDERHARKLLRAAAMTYVAASLLSLVNIARWWAILRR